MDKQQKMADIKLQDLTYISQVSPSNNLESFIQELSDDELNLQGGLLIDKLPPIGPYEQPGPWVPTPTH
jgi:hypothetical protein